MLEAVPVQVLSEGVPLPVEGSSAEVPQVRVHSGAAEAPLVRALSVAVPLLVEGSSVEALPAQVHWEVPPAASWAAKAAPACQGDSLEV